MVIFSSDKGNFKQELQIYNNKQVCVTGIVKEYKGKPEIVITDPQDISIQLESWKSNLNCRWNIKGSN